MNEDHPLFDAKLKIQRARALSNELIASKEAPPDGKPFQQKFARDPVSGIQIVRLDTFPKWLPEQGITAGEIAFHLRSALDYVVYQLCLKGGGDPEKERTAFPISKNPKEYVRLRGRRKTSYRDDCLRNVGEEWKEVIDGLQPFNEIATTDTERLATLNSLTNRDKHRARLKCVTWILTPLCRVVLRRPETIEIVARPGHPVLGIHSPDAPGKSPKELGVTLYPTQRGADEWGAAIGFGPDFVSIDELGWLVDDVERIVAKFEPAFA